MSEPCLTCAANHYCPTHNPAPADEARTFATAPAQALPTSDMDSDGLTIAYMKGFSDGKRAAHPTTAPVVQPADEWSAAVEGAKTGLAAYKARAALSAPVVQEREAPTLPPPAFRLKWRDGAYYVSEPNIGDTDCYTTEQMRAALTASPVAAGPLRMLTREEFDSACWSAHPWSMAQQVQRKFCEVNGLSVAAGVQIADSDSGKGDNKP